MRHFLLFALAVIAGCAPTRTVDSRYQPTQPVEQLRYDAADWQKVLGSAVTAEGYVRYEALTGNQDGVRDALYRYVGLIGRVSPDNRVELFPKREDKLAYFLNAYNALAMYAVLERGLPANTLLSGFPGSIYHGDKFPVGGKATTLHDLEQRIREYEDPRVHFALNCMSNSCPPLRREAYSGEALDGQLKDQGNRYLNDPRGAVAGQDGQVDVSRIFKMYEGDFLDAYRKKTGKSDATLLEAAREYAPESSPLKSATGVRIMKYDWSLNRAPATQPSK